MIKGREDISKKAERKYFDVLKSLLTGNDPFPLVLKGTGIGSSVSFQERMSRIQALQSGVKRPGRPGYSLELVQRNTRDEGPQSFLKYVFFEDRSDYFHSLGKTAEWEALQSDFLKITTSVPELRNWCCQSPRQMIAWQGAWDDILLVLLHFRERRTEGLYLRELPLTLPTKFLENHGGLLRELLDIVLPEERINRSENDIALRYGLEKDRDFRFRILTDPEDHSFHPFRDLAVLPSELALWQPVAEKVLVIENKLSFLRFPERAGMIKIWGNGRSVSLLRNCSWLMDKKLYYWGDLDPHGFEILAQFRVCFPHCRSLCMDRKTFNQFQNYAVPSSPFFKQDNMMLHAEEMECYKMLCTLESGRLEQEKIPLDHVSSCIDLLD